jgi:hypothetical protein
MSKDAISTFGKTGSGFQIDRKIHTPTQTMEAKRQLLFLFIFIREL